MATQQGVQFKRHYHTLSEKQTEELVVAVADLIVNFLKGKRDPDLSEKDMSENRAD